MGGKTVSNFIIPTNDIKKEYEFDFHEEIDQKTVQLCSKLRQNRLHLAEIAKLEQEVKSLQKEKFRNCAKLVQVPLPRGRSTFRKRLYRRPVELEDEVSFKELLLEVPNFVYGVVHECSSWLIVNLDMSKICKKPRTVSHNFGSCKMCRIWSGLIFEKNSQRKRMVNSFVDSGNGLCTVFFRKQNNKQLEAFAECTLTVYKGHQAYQTYVTVDCEDCESKKFPVNGFSYTRTRIHVPIRGKIAL